MRSSIWQGRPLADSLSTLNYGLRPLQRSAYEGARAAQALPHIRFDIATHLADVDAAAENIERFDDLIRQQGANLLRMDPIRAFGSIPLDSTALKINPNAVIYMRNFVREGLQSQRALLEMETELLRLIEAEGIAIPADTASASPDSMQTDTARAAQP